MKDWFKRTEKQLYDYPVWQQRLAHINDQLARLEPRSTASYGAQGGGGGGNNSEPERLAARRADLEQERRYLESKLRAIERVMKVWGDDEKNIFHYKYSQGWNDTQIYTLGVPMSKTKFYYTRSKMVQKAARVWGYYKPVDKVELKMN